jgi:hypothetical protein
LKQEQKNTFDKKLDMLHEEVKKLDGLLKDRQPGLMTWCSMVNERIENIWMLYTRRDPIKIKF